MIGRMIGIPATSFISQNRIVKSRIKNARVLSALSSQIGRPPRPPLQPRDYGEHFQEKWKPVSARKATNAKKLAHVQFLLKLSMR
jgi:hypothetical protein